MSNSIDSNSIDSSDIGFCTSVFKHRPVPSAYKELIKLKIVKTVGSKNIRAVRLCDRAAPVVPVIKRTVQSLYVVILG